MINLNEPNEALLSLIDDYAQILPLDANILITPDRSKIVKKSRLDFMTTKKLWLDPLFKTFPYLAIHEAVKEEVTVNYELNKFINQKINENVLIVLSDQDLTDEEQSIRQAVETKIAQNTKYDPEIDNKDDRGEVKSLAHIHVKDYLYFCSNDANALCLIERAEELDTNLDSISALKIYEIVYYLYKSKMADIDCMRFWYKYHYYLTDFEKSKNPGWGEFKAAMDRLYGEAFETSRGLPTPL